MICPKCKTHVSPHDSVCPKCNFKLTIKCPKCGNDVRRGSAKCDHCGFVFVKFCPQCNSANYISATQCRKCFYEFEKKTPINVVSESKKEAIQKKKEALKVHKAAIQKQQSNTLVFIADFININDIFEKYSDSEFRKKVILNIKTALKMSFGVVCEITKENRAIFSVNYTKKLNVSEKINKFHEEIEKFNHVLSDTLALNIYYKFVIVSEIEYTKKMHLEQLSLGGENDLILSDGAYELLKDELPLVKIAPKSYKMVVLEQRQLLEQNEITPFNTAFNMIVEAIEDKHSEIRIISLNAPRGCGKTYLLNKLANKYRNSEHILLLGQCSPLTQVTPFGLFQDIFLSLFDLDFVSDKFEKKLKETKEFLSKNLPGNFSVNSSAIETLSNLLYPTKEDSSDNILINKEKTFRDLEVILKKLKPNNKLVLIIDDFNLIDSASYEFLQYLIKRDFLDGNTKLLLSYKNQNAAQMYIQNEKLSKSSYLNINLAHKTVKEIIDYIKERFEIENLLPKKILDQIILHSRGNFAYVEQVLDYLMESGKILVVADGVHYDANQEDFCVPQNLDNVLDLRYEILKNQSEIEAKTLCLASFLGGKFSADILENVLEIDSEKILEILETLEQKDFIRKIDEKHYIFKNNLIWSYVYNKVKNNSEFYELEEKFLSELSQKTLTTPALKALISESIDNKELAYEFWSKNLPIISYIGDDGLYVLAQKQILSIIDFLNIPNVAVLKNSICENIGKLIYKKRPQEAFEYLRNGILWAQKCGDNNKVVELSGYLIESGKILQKYPIITETVDLVLSIYSKPKMNLQRALIKTRKLSALLRMGNWGEIVNLVNNEINPILQNALKFPKNTSYVTHYDIYKTWISANLILARAYAQSGNPASFELLNEIERELNKKKLQEPDISQIKVDFMLSRAMAYTIKGMVNVSDDILQTIVKDYSYIIHDSETISEWNLIDITNKVFSANFDTLKSELFEAVSFAHDNGDNFSKNILKIFLADVLLEETDILKSLEICSKQMIYCSEEKIALGVLIAWYISAKATLLTDGIDKAIEICEKSIQICKNAKINNTFFNIMFNVILANAYLKKGELDNAKMYSELALQEANSNELLYLQMQILRVRANCMKDTLMSLPDVKKLNMKDNIIRTFEKALKISNKLGCDKVSYLIQKDLTAFIAHCQLNGIEEEPQAD